MSVCRLLQNTCRISGTNLTKSFRAPFNGFSTSALRLTPSISKIIENQKPSVLSMPIKRFLNDSSIAYQKIDKAIEKAEKQVEKDKAKEEKEDRPSRVHSVLWLTERIVALFLIVGIPAALFSQNNGLDFALATAMVMHSHWGLDNIITDYVHTDTMMKVSRVSIFIISILTLAGLYYFNFNDIGISEAIAKLWKIESKKAEEAPAE